MASSTSWSDRRQPSGGWLRVPEPLRRHADASCELFAIRDDFDRLVARGGDELLLPQFVPAGEYGLACRDATGALRFGRVHVAAGERATLRLDDLDPR